jgi:ATP-dependent Clp protease ATP-binding subunit ClpA
VDDVIALRPLARADLASVLDRQLAQAAAAAAARHGVELRVDAAARAALVAEAEQQGRGARPLAGLVRKRVLGPLAEALLAGGAVGGGGAAAAAAPGARVAVVEAAVGVAAPRWVLRLLAAQA